MVENDQAPMNAAPTKDGGSSGLATVERLLEVRSRIEQATDDFGRKAGDVKLVCVSKTHPAERIQPVLKAGQRIFGENRVQEALSKWPQLREEFKDIELHLIGPLQSNKVREAVAAFDVIETIDRWKIAEAIAAEIARTGKQLRLLVEINTGLEPQKSGIAPAEADLFLRDCRQRLGINIEGLMCIPPETGQKSPHFALLSMIAARNGLKTLSMGMSADFELAVQLGATHVRVGSAIFGERG